MVEALAVEGFLQGDLGTSLVGGEGRRRIDKIGKECIR